MVCVWPQITTYIMFYNKVSALFIVQHVLNLVIPFEIEMHAGIAFSCRE